jgi:ferredoxin
MGGARGAEVFIRDWWRCPIKGSPALDPASGPSLTVRIDQDLCTGDGLCVQYARPVFEMDLDGLAYVKGADDELQTAPGATVLVPLGLEADVIASAKECPGRCIHVARADDGTAVAGPDAGD